MTSYVKTQRTFSFIRRYGWLVTLIIALGGLWAPRLGLLVPPIMAALMVMSLFGGKYWCGNYCFHGSLFDTLVMPRSRNIKTPALLRSRGFIALFFIIFMFALARRLITVFEHPGGADFWDRLGFAFVLTYLVVTVAGSALNIFLNPRAWCHFCPMGTIQSLLYKAGKYLPWTDSWGKKVAIKDGSLCLSCGKCSRVCPMQLEPHGELMNSKILHNGACIRCGVCTRHCPQNLLSLETPSKIFHKKEGNIIRLEKVR